MSRRSRLKKSRGLFFTVGVLFLLMALAVFLFIDKKNSKTNNITLSPVFTDNFNSQEELLDKPALNKILKGGTQVFQTFNNCGPASLSMTLSYYGITKSQEELGKKLRPYQIPNGDNDDKSVTLSELSEHTKEYNLIPYHRPNGDIDKIKLFITYNIPVLTRTLLYENDDIGHYRVVKGYDENTNEIIQDDSLQGKDLRFSYNKFEKLWSRFNYEYVVLATNDQKKIVEQILKEDVNKKTAWEKAVSNAQDKLLKNPDDLYARFNLSVAYYNIGEYEKSAEEFEKVENYLSFRTLWYQIEPIEAYYKIGNYDKVFSLTSKILNNQNRAFSELYIIRGNIYKNLGDLEKAKEEYRNAYLYNENIIIPEI